MIIPVKCFTCGNVLADKYRYYVREVRKIKSNAAGNSDQQMSWNKVEYLTKSTSGDEPKTAECQVLDTLKLTKICCRRHMLTHVDIE